MNRPTIFLLVGSLGNHTLSIYGQLSLRADNNSTNELTTKAMIDLHLLEAKALTLKGLK